MHVQANSQSGWLSFSSCTYTIKIQVINVIHVEFGDLFPFQLMNMLDSFPAWPVRNQSIAQPSVSQVHETNKYPARTPIPLSITDVLPFFRPPATKQVIRDAPQNISNNISGPMRNSPMSCISKYFKEYSSAGS